MLQIDDLANIEPYAGLPAEAGPGRTVPPHCWAAARERITSHQGAGIKLVDNDDEGVAYRLSSRYGAICGATRRGIARPYRPPTLLGSC